MGIAATAWVIGFGLAGLIAGLGLAAGALSVTGTVAATVVGGVVFGTGGLGAAFLLVAFFATSSLLSRVTSAGKQEAKDKFSKGSRRDAGQVLANGAVAALVAGLVHPGGSRSVVGWACYAGAVAAANADTWATELGVLAGRSPRLVTSWQRVEPGTSGAVTLVGSLASLAGALLIAVLAAGIEPSSGPGALAVALAVFLGGTAGSLADSLLGGTVQGIYRCSGCGRATEQHPVHRCGAQTQLERGWPVINNEMVNFACTCVGALVAWGAMLLLA